MESNPTEGGSMYEYLNYLSIWITFERSKLGIIWTMDGLKGKK